MRCVIRKFVRPSACERNSRYQDEVQYVARYS